MKTFAALQEDRGEKAFKQAIQMGLKYAGFGYWKDPQTGETKFKTENDTLVPVEADIESEKYTGGKPGEGTGNPDFAGGPGGDAGQGMANAAGMLQMPGGGQAQAGAGIQGAPMPGQEKARAEKNWEPGPDGDTCVGAEAQKPGQVPQDSFVGRTNYMKWTAGPDGNNITNVSYEKLKEAMLEGIDTNIRRADKAADIIAGRKRSTVGPGTKSLGGKALSRAMKQTQKTYNSADYEPSIAPGTMTDDRDSSVASGPSAPRPKVSKKKKANPKQEAKRQEITDNMNKQFKKLGLEAQPDLDINDILENGKHVGEGIQGAVSLSKDKKTVAKKGHIGAHELEALARMKDHPGFPTLLAAEFDGPFGNIDPVKNNPEGDSGLGRLGKFYQDHNYGSNFYTKFPGAPGKFAMTAAKGEELHDVPFMDADSEQYEMSKKFHQMRRDMHKQGIAHNDMHGGNVFYDEDSGDLSVLDFGLASVSPIRALMEALGGMNGRNPMEIALGSGSPSEAGDYQIADEFKGNEMAQSDHFDTEQMGSMFMRNVDKIRQRLMDNMDVSDLNKDDFDDEYEYEDELNTRRSLYEPFVDRFLRGGIRLNKPQVKELIDNIPFISPDQHEEGEFSGDYGPDDNRVMELIDMLYDGLEDTPFAKNATQLQRMSRGYDDMVKQIGKDDPVYKGQAGLDLVKTVNKMRKEKDKKPLGIKGLDIGPGNEKPSRIPDKRRVFDKITDHDD